MTQPSAPENKTGTRARKQTKTTKLAKAPKVPPAAKAATTTAKAVTTKTTTTAKMLGVAPAAATFTEREVLVPLDQLFISEANVRKVHQDDGIAELSALIDAQGLLQRLCVVPHDDGRCAVVAGGRRLRAMQLLVSSGRWTPAQPVECKLVDKAQAVQVSLAENSGRQGMHPADQMEAFKTLIDEGLTVGQVAGRFGVSPLTVERRLKLARLAPRFMDLYRADEIEPDQLIALALVDDHSAQESVWDGLSVHSRSAWRIKEVVTSEAISADSRLAIFVGLDHYEAEGGRVRRDLFSSPDDLSGVYLESPELLQTLAMEKLRGVAAVIKEEGWSWCDCMLEADAMTLRHYGRVRQEEREPTLEEAEAIERLAAEQRQHADVYEKHLDEGDDSAENYDEIERQLCEAVDVAEENLMAARADLLQWSPERLASAGATLRIDRHGEVVVQRGLVRPEDRKASRGAMSDEGDDESAPRDVVAKAKPEFSEPLMRDLTAHRTAAIQAALMQDPHIALVTLVHRMAETVFSLHGAGDDIVKMTVRMTGDSTLSQEASEYPYSPAAALLGAAETEWGDRLPGSPAALFRWLLAQPQSTLLELLAYCTARTVNAIAARPRGFNHSDALVEALDIDMADWWVATPASYFDRVSKTKAMEAVKEATGIDPGAATAGLKKDEVVAYCASKLEGTRWLPSPLRRSTAEDVINALNKEGGNLSD
ncbi:ParB/RepB/Spo0J family partition protein [Variovorax sp. GrIS 2.14]|uniref:ParB/RepB/Spo0J family partition protein n=1 Tax=Variovorax sp. GrIS 2.14 TaxID=3071709 RepID=UPI0038F64C4B